MGSMSRSDFANQMVVGIDAMFQNYNKDYPLEYTKFFKVMNLDKASKKISSMFGTGLYKETAELENYATDSGGAGPEKTVYPIKFSSGFQISEEAKEDGLYGDLVQKFVAYLKRMGMVSQDVYFMDFLNNHASYTTADGVALFSTSHIITKTGGTFANRLTDLSDLAPESIKSLRIAVKKMVSPEGIRQNYKLSGLWGSFELEDTAEEISKSTLTPYKEDNTANILNGKYSFTGFNYITNPKMWGGYVEGVDEGMVALNRRELRIDSAYIDPNNKSTKVTASMRKGVYMGDPRDKVLGQG